MERQRRGRIINISSISAQTGGVSGGVHYSSSKGGMIAMTKTLARDLAPFGVTVNAIAPGQIDTNPKLLTAEGRQRIIAQIPLGRLGVPEDIAYAALFLVSPMASYITGTTLDVNGGLLKRYKRTNRTIRLPGSRSLRARANELPRGKSRGIVSCSRTSFRA